MDNFKHFIAQDAVFYSLLITLVAVTAYGMGQHSAVVKVDSSSAAQVVLIEEPAGEVVNAENAANQQLVASKNGSKYHYLWCPGASQMKDENKVFFDSVESARAAGYEPAANCEGLQ